MKYMLFIFLFQVSVLVSAVENKIIFINTMPKSGSMFISHVLQRNTNYPFVRISLNRFHDDYLQEKLIEENRKYLCLTQEHVDASLKNIQILEKYFSKIVLHLRDPRQQLISWVHHVENWKWNTLPLISEDIQMPCDYFEWEFSKKIDWQIENFLPSLVNWLEEWCDVLDSNQNLDILVTHFEEMKANPQAFFQKIAAFFNIPIGKFSIPYFQKNTLHQRKGKIDEWKRVLTPLQIQRMHEIIPQDLMIRFGWNLLS